jgi:hypothetical protein
VNFIRKGTVSHSISSVQFMGKPLGNFLDFSQNPEGHKVKRVDLQETLLVSPSGRVETPRLEAKRKFV